MTKKAKNIENFVNMKKVFQFFLKIGGWMLFAGKMIGHLVGRKRWPNRIFITFALRKKLTKINF